MEESDTKESLPIHVILGVSEYTKIKMAGYWRAGVHHLDVLGLQDTPIGDQNVVHQQFLEQLKRHPDGWYETALPWKGNHPPPPCRTMRPEALSVLDP